jgi:hypothetical protein
MIIGSGIVAAPANDVRKDPIAALALQPEERIAELRRIRV